MNVYESSAKTIEEAITQGLAKMSASIGDVEIEILEEGSKGLFGIFGSKLAKVKLTRKNVAESDEDLLSALNMDQPLDKAVQKQKPSRPEKPAAPKSAPKQEKPAAPKSQPAQAKAVTEQPKPVKPAQPIVPAAQKDPATLEGIAQSFLQDVTRLMNVEVSVDVHTDDEGAIRVDMQGDTLGVLIGRRGETLDALQYLTSLQVNKGRDEYTRVTLDIENYRAKREEALVRLANRMATRAVKTGRRVVLEPMNPYERRILHSALQSNESVSTHSEGEDQNRHVVITLNK